MTKRAYQPVRSPVACGLAVLSIVLAVAGTVLGAKPDNSERVHYFVWYEDGSLALDAFWPYGPDAPLVPGNDLPQSEYGEVAGGVIADPGDPGLVINAGQTNLASGDQAVKPPALGGDDSIVHDPDGEGVLTACFPADEDHIDGWYFGTHFISGDLRTIQMNISGLAKGGGPKWYTLIISIASVEPDGPGGLLDLAEGTTATLSLGEWELKTGTGPTNKGCHAFGDLTTECTTVKVRRFTANEEVLQRQEEPTPPSPGITVNPTSGLVTSEKGGTASFTVVLDTQPAADVTIPVSSSNTDEGEVDALALLFTPNNWNAVQTVVVTGQDDNPPIRDGDIAYTIVLGLAASDGTDYGGMNTDDVSVVNIDNEKGKPPK